MPWLSAECFGVYGLLAYCEECMVVGTIDVIIKSIKPFLHASIYHDMTILVIGKRFASPIKQGPRQKLERRRAEDRILSLPMSSSSETPVQSVGPSTPPPSYVTNTGEQLLDTGYQVHELPNIGDDDINDHVPDAGTDPVVHTALLARIEYLEAENARLKSVCSQDILERILRMMCFYTGFTSFKVFQAFLSF